MVYFSANLCKWQIGFPGASRMTFNWYGSKSFSYLIELGLIASVNMEVTTTKCTIYYEWIKV